MEMEQEWGPGMSKPWNSCLEIMVSPALGLCPDAHNPVLLPTLYQKTSYNPLAGLNFLPPYKVQQSQEFLLMLIKHPQNPGQ